MLGFEILGNYLQAGNPLQHQQAIGTDINAEQTGAIAANKAALPGMEGLASDYNAFTKSEMDKTLASIPGYSDRASKYLSLMDSEMAGQLTPAEIAADERMSAQRAAGGGVGGSVFGGNMTAESLGLDVRKLISQGMSHAEGWLKNAQSLYMPHMLNIAPMFQTLEGRLANTRANNETQMGVNWLNSKIDAMPDPMMAAIGKGINAEDQQIAGLASSYGGMAAGGAPKGGGGGNANATGAGTGGDWSWS